MRFLLFLIPLFLCAIPPLNEVLNYPNSYYKDFWLIQHLKKTTNPQTAENIYNEITYKKDFHLKLLSKKNPIYKRLYECLHINKDNYLNYSYKCIVNNGFKLSDIKKMDIDEIVTLLNYIPQSKIKTEIEILFTKNYKKIFKNRDVFYDLYLLIPDIEIPDIYLNNLAKSKRFGWFLSYIIRSKREKIKKSLLNLHYKEIKDKYKFELALNAINYKRYNLAVKILQSKKEKTTQDIFWLYLLTKDKKYANKLLNHKRLDIYVLYIYEKFNKQYKIDKVKIFNSIRPKYDINNPLDVIKFQKDKAVIKDYFQFAKQLDAQANLPLKTIILDKAYKYTKNYYIMPNYNLKNLNTKQKALFYALARQESRFIPAQTSGSYAIGLMQMMPFLIRSFRPKEKFEDFWRDDVNVKYAKKHLLWLMKNLNNNPLFVAYAYNGGIGFTKRKVIPYFKYKGEFEPFLSMEMIPYSESREYAKKVLTNYVIYMNLLGQKITLHQLLTH